MNIAIIPARGGSKRIIKKNIRKFCGTPIIEYTINALKKSNLFEKIVVSTDDSEIAEVAEKNNAIVPFIRPKELSDDETGVLPVVRHAAKIINDEFKLNLQYVCCAYATAPLLDEMDIIRGLKVIEGNKSDFMVPITKFHYPIMRAISITSDNLLEMTFPNILNKRSNDLDEYYHDVGSFYWASFKALIENKEILKSNTSYIKIPNYKVIDIDDQEDWKRAELMYQIINNNNQK